MSGYYRVITDGKTFRIQRIERGCEPKFFGCPFPLEFSSKEAVERYIHENLSHSGWWEA